MVSLVDQTVSHYTILEHVGGGGLGVVYKARDLKLDRTVALKFLPPNLTNDPIARERFIREAKAASALQHNNICVIHEIDQTADGQLFICMDFYEGETLKTLLERKAVDIPLTLEIARQLAEGLAQAHRHGIIHRDIKPENIFITSQGTVKILDFGLATLAGRTRLTQTGYAVGTLAYMSPEAIAGEDLDERADIWALGVTLFEMLTQHLPFRGEQSPALMYSIANEEPTDIRRLRVDTPEFMRELCLRCLRKNRLARPQSMEEIIVRLSNNRQGVGGELVRALRRHGARTVLSAVVLLGLLAAAWFLSQREHQTLAPATRARVAILPFRNPGGDSAVSLLTRDGQALLAAEFIGVEWLGVVDPLSLNGILESSLGSADPDRGPELYRVIRQRAVDFLVDASVYSSTSGYRLHTGVIDLSRDPSDLAFISTETAAGDAEMPAAIGAMAGKVLDFLEVRVLHENKDRDIRPWLLHRKSSAPALKAFSRAWESMYRADYDEAVRYLRLAIELDSTYVSPRVWLIPHLVAEGRVGDAEEEYRSLRRIELEVNPFERKMIDWAAACIQHDVARQSACLEEALAYSPENNLLLGNLAYNRYLMNDFGGALSALAPCLESQWRYPPLYPLAAICFIKVDRFGDARYTLEQSLSMSVVDSRTFSLLSALCLQAHDSAASTRYADEFIQVSQQRGDSMSEASALLGDHFSLVGMFDQAAEWYMKAIRDAAQVSLYREKLGEVLYRGGRKNEALRELDRAIQLDPHASRSHLLTAKIYDEMGDTVAALAHYRLCILSDSTIAEAASIRRRIQSIQR